jgi:hypothetical protein
LVGKFSRVERQIDILVEEQPSDLSFRIVVDAKYRGRKIDVGDVEAFWVSFGIRERTLE